MVNHLYEELDRAPLIRGHVYLYGPKGGATDNPYSKLLGVGNTGGIRPRKGKGNQYAFVVLTSALDSSWVDTFDKDTGILVYHGDNDTPDSDELKRGNKALMKVFKDCANGAELVPLLFFRTREKQGESPAGVEFVGLFAPMLKEDGSPHFEEYSQERDGGIIRNFTYHMKLVDTADEDIKGWLLTRVNDSPSKAYVEPDEWKRVLRDGVSMGEGTKGTYGLDISDNNKAVEGSFFDYLESKNLFYPKETVESFLLSIKAKSFLILTGGSGTGKTKLAQSYGQFISNQRHRWIEVPIKLGKSDDTHGWFLNKETMSAVYPWLTELENRDARLGDASDELRLEPMVRGSYKRDRFQKEIVRMKNEGVDKASLYIDFGTDSKKYQVVPVGSNWNEARFIKGYYNPITKQYNNVDAIELILRAIEDPANRYILILDEMNLSHVERYFSDFLSAMESGEDIELHGCEEMTYPPMRIPFPQNLIVIGTVNIDETTYMFSPKVLDRANVIEFAATDISLMFGEMKGGEEPRGDIGYLQDPLRRVDSIDIEKIVSMLPHSDQIKDKLIEIHQVMSEYNMEFGFRTVGEILRFMYAAWEYERRGEDYDWKHYLDVQIMQKILPKIHGNSSIGVMLRDLAQICSEDFPCSHRKLERMKKVLEANRYVSFIC